MSSLKASTVGSDVRIKPEAWGDSVMAVAPRLGLSSSVHISGYQGVKAKQKNDGGLFLPYMSPAKEGKFWVFTGKCGL